MEESNECVLLWNGGTDRAMKYVTEMSHLIVSFSGAWACRTRFIISMTPINIVFVPKNSMGFTGGIAANDFLLVTFARF